MRYVLIGIGVFMLAILAITGSPFINNSSRILPTPTPTVNQPSQEALKVAAYAVINANAADRKILKEKYGDLSDNDYTYQLALDLTKNPTQLAVVEATEEKNKNQKQGTQPPVVVNQPIQMPQYNPPVMVSAPRTVTCHTFYNGDVSCY